MAAANALPLAFSPNLRQYCLSQLDCRPSSHPTSFSAANASMIILQASSKHIQRQENNIASTFILAISSFSALVNLASVYGD